MRLSLSSLQIMRGSEGTPAYLPPEVILHGGSTSFSTKLDVYSFGMLLYYLFTFLGPFETERGRPVSALLDEMKRPELAIAVSEHGSIIQHQ